MGALIGTAVGDALGALFEGRDPAEINEIRDAAKKPPLLTYTDDTHMMIGVAESLIHSRGFNAGDMLSRFIKNYEAEPHRGYAAGPPYIFERVKRGSDWRQVSHEMYAGGSYGNGSAMRIAPVGVFYSDDIAGLKRVAYQSSEITHAHPLAQEGAAVEAYAIALATGLEPGPAFSVVDFISALMNFSQNEVYKAKLNIIDKFSGEMDKDSVALELGNGVEAFNSVPTAIYSFLAFPGSFADAVLKAISLGGDTDTLGAMTGAISGAYLGSQAIPEEWVRKLENRGYIETLAEQLFATKIEISRST